MAKKRAPGGGMKPRGEYSGLTSVLSLRMPAEMREELEKAARARSRKENKDISLSQELLGRLRRSFVRDSNEARDPALQAVCYLIGEVAEGVTSPFPIRFGNLRPLWRSNPFLFRAFKLAVGKLLDALEPKGEIKTPVTLEVAKGHTLDLTFPSFVANRYQTPEALADFVAAGIWQALIRTTPLTVMDPRITRWDLNVDYDMDRARRDLSVKPQGGKS